MKTRILMFLALFSTAFSLSGCSPYPTKAAPVDEELALQTLTSFLEAWKGGRAIEELAREPVPVVGQDFDWMSGKQLLSYRISGSGIPQDANLRVEVELDLTDQSESKRTKKVIYIVGTDPSLTVFRGFE